MWRYDIVNGLVFGIGEVRLYSGFAWPSRFDKSYNRGKEETEDLGLSFSLTRWCDQF